VLGVALLVLRSDARLDVVGLVAMVAAAIMFSVATVLTKRWGRCRWWWANRARSTGDDDDQH
jgi:drug/metabolite transporter (DMT)-like permease